LTFKDELELICASLNRKFRPVGRTCKTDSNITSIPPNSHGGRGWKGRKLASIFTL